MRAYRRRYSQNELFSSDACDVSNSLQVYLREIKDESRLTADGRM